MKKIATLAVLPVIALASCSKNEEVVNVTPTPLESENSTQEQLSTQENLNQNISSTSVDSETMETEKSFEFSYEKDGNIIPVSGKFVLENWVVTEMIIDWVDLNTNTPLASFAKNAPAQIIWKELKWLQIDTVSWASYVTTWFNSFLATFE